MRFTIFSAILEMENILGFIFFFLLYTFSLEFIEIYLTLNLEAESSARFLLLKRLKIMEENKTQTQ